MVAFGGRLPVTLGDVSHSLRALFACALVDLEKLALLPKGCPFGRAEDVSEEDEQEEILQILLAYFLAFSSSGYGPAVRETGKNEISSLLFWFQVETFNKLTQFWVNRFGSYLRTRL